MADTTDATNITYPPGCKEVNEELGADELIRRLKNLAQTFQSMGQDDNAYQEYIPLALHLASEYFLTHPSRDVQLLIACCIADILRVYAPEAPYSDPEQVKTIFMFLIRQLEGLKDPKDPAFKRYFYLLENLAYVKSFNMCFDLEQAQEIFCSLFSLIFRIVNDEHSGKVKNFMLDILTPIVQESDNLSNELLNIILMNFVEPNKSQKKNAFSLARELVIKCSDTIETYIQSFFNQVLVLGKDDRTYPIARKVYELIYELNHICSSVLIAVLPQLEFKLKSADETERMSAVSLLARMFSEKESSLASQHRPLWIAFLGRFNDISVNIRTKCVQYSMHFLLNHPELRADITETLKLRQHDGDEGVRYEVVMAIVTTAKRDFSVVSDSEDLLNFVKERTLDKKFKIRKEAMCGLAHIYKKHLSSADVPEATKKACQWIKDKILHGYYMSGLEDRLLVERLLNTCLVPWQLPADDRMKKLYYLFGTIDDNANKAFIELQKSQMAVRKNVADMVELYGGSLSVEEREKELIPRINLLAKFLPDPIKASEFIHKFANHLSQDRTLLRLLETVVDPEVSCKDCAEAMTALLKKLGQPVMTNLYHSTIKALLERACSVLVDKEAIQILVGYVENCIHRGGVADEIGVDSITAGEKGLRLLFVLSFAFPACFLTEDVLKRLVALLDTEDETIPPLVLPILTFAGKYRPIGDAFPEVAEVLFPTCQRLALTGTAKQAKNAVRCLFVNAMGNHEGVLGPLVESLKENLSLENPYFRTALVSLGHIALTVPDKFTIQIKNIVSRKVVRELLMRQSTEPTDKVPTGDWCDEEDLPEETRCKMEGMKMMARWLLGLGTDVVSAQKTFRMLSTFISHKGDLLEENKISNAEKAHLRLRAGCAMLKIIEQKGVGDQYTAEQFYVLSRLMADEVGQVRERFAEKMHKGLTKGMLLKCLPLDFMGMYALAGQDPDKRIKAQVRQYMITDINKRRDYIKNLMMSGGADKAAEQLPYIMPDYMLVFAVPILTHDPAFERYDQVEQLQRIRQCLWFVLEPLMTKTDTYCFGFYKALVERMKNHKDALKGDDEATNLKMWTVCDLAMGLIMSKTTSFEMKEFPAEPRIPPMYFRKHEDSTFVNSRSYLPPELQHSAPKRSGITVAVVGMGTNSNNTSVQSANMTGNTGSGNRRKGKILTRKQDDVETSEGEENLDSDRSELWHPGMDSGNARRKTRTAKGDEQVMTSEELKAKMKGNLTKITTYFTQIDKADESDEQTPKRGRGRPARKAKFANATTSASEADSAEEGENETRGNKRQLEDEEEEEEEDSAPAKKEAKASDDASVARRVTRSRK